MLSRLFSWLGWGPARTPPSGPTRPKRPRSATGHLFEKRPGGTDSRPNAAPSAEGDFNPYNTGKFDRSASWDRISKNKR
jgi:hypothetical protein